MKTTFRGITGLLLATAALVPNLVSAAGFLNHAPHELFGCAPDSIAAHLIGSGAFSTSGGPIVILCAQGYTAVHRVLP